MSHKLAILSIVLIIVSITLFVIYFAKSDKKGILISILSFLFFTLILFISIYSGKKEATAYLNSWKSEQIKKAERQYLYLQNQPKIKVEKFVKMKLSNFIEKPNLRDSISFYNPNNYYSSTELKQFENSILKAVTKYLEVSPKIGKENQNHFEINKASLELIKESPDVPMIFISRGISIDSTTFLVKSFYNPLTNEIGVIEITQCYVPFSQAYIHITDMKDELVFYSSLPKCSKELRSQCHFWNSIAEKFRSQYENLFSINESATFLIDGQKYPSYRLFNFKVLLKVTVKPTIKIDLLREKFIKN